MFLSSQSQNARTSSHARTGFVSRSVQRVRTDVHLVVCATFARLDPPKVPALALLRFARFSPSGFACRSDDVLATRTKQFRSLPQPTSTSSRNRVKPRIGTKQQESFGGPSEQARRMDVLKKRKEAVERFFGADSFAHSGFYTPSGRYSGSRDIKRVLGKQVPA